MVVGVRLSSVVVPLLFIISVSCRGSIVDVEDVGGETPEEVVVRYFICFVLICNSNLFLDNSN